MIARWFGAAQLQAVQRRFAGQRRAVRALRRQLACQHSQHRIMSQFVVVVQVLVAERDANDALHHHGVDPMLHQFGRARVGEAGGEPLGQADRPVGLAQQQGARRARGSHHRRRSPCRRGYRRVEIQTGRDYSLSALGRPGDSRKTAVTTRFFQNPCPNAPDSGRVEDGRGSPAPFPVPAHRTQRADFPH